jgi:drug/metabolite transporter (DMT)-like permease
MAIFFATILLGEPLTLSFVVGGLLTMFGVGIVLFRSSKPAPAVDVAAPMAAVIETPPDARETAKP